MTCRATTAMGASLLMVTSSTPVPSATAIDAAASRKSSRRPLVTSLASRCSMSDNRTVRRTTRSGNPRASRTRQPNNVTIGSGNRRLGQHLVLGWREFS